MKHYDGMRIAGKAMVTVNGHPLDTRHDLRNHSRDGFEWGYGGDGPAQLALAIVADHLQDDHQALSLYQDFKWAIVAVLPYAGWTLTQDALTNILQFLSLRGDGSSTLDASRYNTT